MAHTTLESIYELADNYLSGNLSDQDQDDFEARLRSDEAFRQLIKDYFTFKLAVRSSAREAFKAEVEASLGDAVKNTPDFRAWNKEYTK